MLVRKTVTELLDALAAPTPTPGGGSAAALAGAAAASLLVMVAAMPKTKHGTPEDRSALDGALAKLQPLRSRLTALIDEDAASYDGVVAAYKLPKGTDEEKAARKVAVQAAMRHATDVPIDTFRAAAALFPLARIVAEHGNPNAKSDAGVGAQLAWAAMTGAHANVEINLDGTGDAGFATETRAALKTELTSASETLSAVYAAIAWQNHLPPRS